MNGQIYQIDLGQMEQLLKQAGMGPEHLNIMLGAGRVTRHLYAGIFDGRLLCLLGVMPQTLLSGGAYLWCWTAEEVISHRIAFGRQAIRFIQNLRARYDSITGHCLNDCSWRWLESLGAIRTSQTTFEIASWPHH